MVVVREGVMRTYRSEIVPENKIEVLNHLRQQGPPEDSINNKPELIDPEYEQDSGEIMDLDLTQYDQQTLGGLSRARNIQVSTLSLVSKIESQDGVGEQQPTMDDDDEPNEQVEVKSQIVRHETLDAPEIDNDNTRRAIVKTRATEILTVGVNLAPQEFLVRAGRSEQPLKLLHVGINLSNSDPKGLDRREGPRIQEELDAFDDPSLNGMVTMHVKFNDLSEVEEPPSDDEDAPVIVQDPSGIKGVTFEVENITFSFAVSGNRSQSSRFDEHDKQSLIRLVGDLGKGSAPGGFVGEIIDRMEARLRDDELTDSERDAINDQIMKLRREVDNARTMFNSGIYKQVHNDSHKMARTVMRIVDLSNDAMQRLLPESGMYMMLSESSRTLEGVSLGDVEHKSQVIIEDMGGRERPGARWPEQDRIIYNTVLTSSGQIETQEMLTGLPGSTLVFESGSGNLGATQYATGLQEPQKPR